MREGRNGEYIYVVTRTQVVHVNTYFLHKFEGLCVARKCVLSLAKGLVYLIRIKIRET